MLSEMCLYLKNWFNWNQPKYFGKFKVEDGVLISLNDGNMGIKTGQYYRIVGSVFNDGVYKHGSESLIDESFDGAVWLMAVPPDAESLATEISLWVTKYGGVDSQSMSPYNSESYGGYSYSKSGGGSSSVSASSVPTWQSVFADRLGRYRKV